MRCLSNHVVGGSILALMRDHEVSEGALRKYIALFKQQEEAAANQVLQPNAGVRKDRMKNG